MLDLFTIGQIAQLLRKQPHQVRYLVSRRKIKPTGRVRHYKVFSAAKVEAIRRAFARTRRSP